MNYFSLFSLPTHFAIDEVALKKNYFELQRQFHPDKAGLKGVQTSMELNQAYQTLTHPLKRAQHLLGLYGVDVGHDHSRIKPDMALLEEMMEKREAVMELEDAAATSELLTKANQQYEQELECFAAIAEELGEVSTNFYLARNDSSITPPACGGGKGGAGAASEKDASASRKVESTSVQVGKSPPLIPPASGGEVCKNDASGGEEVKDSASVGAEGKRAASGAAAQNAAQSLLRLQYIAKWQAEIKLQLKKSQA